MLKVQSLLRLCDEHLVKKDEKEDEKKEKKEGEEGGLLQAVCRKT